MNLEKFKRRLLYQANMISSPAIKASDIHLAKLLAPRSKAGRAKGAK